MKTLFRLVVLFLVPGVIACSGSQVSGSGSAVSTGAARPQTTLAQSRQEYLQALVQLEQGDYPSAMEGFQRVARGPSYIVYSPLARLRFADALFFQEKYEEAVEAYRAFIETSAGDPNVHYAFYRLAESKVRSIASDFFLVPPSDRRDQKRVRSALQSLLDFVARYPDSPYLPEATVMLDRMTATVASFEMEVARFYLSREKPAGAVQRLRQLLKDVPRTARQEETRAALVEALAAGGRDEELATECDAYRRLFPDGENRKQVASLCKGRAKQDSGPL